MVQGPLSVRVAEYHDQDAPGPGLPDPNHYDQDSAVTIDIMLSEPGVDFEVSAALKRASQTAPAPTTDMMNGCRFATHLPWPLL